MGATILQHIKRLPLLLLLGTALHGQSPHFVRITPEKATLLVGESRTFRLVNQDGQMQKKPFWSVSDPDALQPQSGDELVITAKAAGRYFIRAKSDEGSAEATLEVMEGTSLPMGTATWSSPAIDGCKSVKVTPAVPSSSGVDVFDQSVCPDGEYLAAYTADGTQVWRRKISGGTPAPLPVAGNDPKATAKTSTGRLDFHSPSFCDSLVIGTTRQIIQGLLSQRKLTFNEGRAADRTWSVDESGAQCKLWFDEHSVLTKKQKILVSE